MTNPVSLMADGSNPECGERGIRTPGTLLEYTRFPGGPVKPLLHLSHRPPNLSSPSEASAEEVAKEGCLIIIPFNGGANYKIF